MSLPQDDDLIILPKTAVPAGYIGNVLVEHLSDKYSINSVGNDTGIRKVVAQRGFTLDWTEEWERAHPADAVLAKAANILIARTLQANKLRAA